MARHNPRSLTGSFVYKNRFGLILESSQENGYHLSGSDTRLLAPQPCAGVSQFFFRIVFDDVSVSDHDALDVAVE